MNTNQAPSVTHAPADPQCGALAVAPGSASVGIGQVRAAEVWNLFKSEELRYVDILEMCAVLMLNVADKSKSTDHEIAHLTRQLMHDARKRAPNNGNEPRA